MIPNLCEISNRLKITMLSPFSFHDPTTMQRSKGQASKGELWLRGGPNQDRLFQYVVRAHCFRSDTPTPILALTHNPVRLHSIL